MAKEESLYREIGLSLPDAKESQMFGKPCFKIGDKAFICFFQDCMVFKLTGDALHEAMGLEGAQLFDPSGKQRPMKEWVQVPYTHHMHWRRLADEALEYVGG